MASAPPNIKLQRKEKLMSNKNWCFTVNNYTQAHVETLTEVATNAAIQYLIFQGEVGEQGTPHLQGFVQCKTRRALRPMQTLLGCGPIHLEPMRGTAQQASDYCEKAEGQEAGPWCFGEMVGKGKRNDLVVFLEAMRERVLTPNQVEDEFPLIAAKYPRFENRLRNRFEEEKIDFSPFIPYTNWQAGLWEACLTACDTRRTIKWYFDGPGGSGKSLFAVGLGVLRIAYVITGGKHQDILYAYNREPVVIFDLPRDFEDRVPYNLMELFKNGYYLKSKYESVPFYFSIPHVIIFANFYPVLEKLSADRWEIHDISN